MALDPVTAVAGAVGELFKGVASSIDSLSQLSIAKKSFADKEEQRVYNAYMIEEQQEQAQIARLLNQKQNIQLAILGAGVLVIGLLIYLKIKN